MLNDPVSDFLTRIRNANMVFKPEVECPSSKMKEAIARIMEREGFIKGYRVRKSGKKNFITVYLKYLDGRKRVITHLEQVSKPSRRIYVGKKEIPKVLNNLGICILSTSKGIYTGEEARKLGVGGEVICYIW
ncbi:30S ribosomal protein S8 [Candidatus Aerophobetes bacterium]|nr:30S ribosomal protein S8 [Candidatus Aerophobetes bacterium]